MAVKVGKIEPYATSYRVMSGSPGTDTFFEEIFPYNKYGGARKAKRAALKFWNSDAFQNRAKDMSSEGKSAKTVGLTFDEYVKLSEIERRALKRKKKLEKKFKLKQESGALDLKFTVNKKPYTITKSRKGLPPNIPLLKKFIKSFDKWKAGDKTLRSYYDMSHKLSPQTRTYWRQLANFAKGKDPVTREGMNVKVWNKFFEDLKLPEEELNTLKTFTDKNYQKLSVERIGPKAWASLGSTNPLTIPVLKYLSKNPDATPSEFTKGIRAATGKKYSNKVIIDAAVNTHRGGTVKMIRLGSGETIGETQLKAFTDYDENSLRGILKSLFHLYPAKMRRDFGLTLNEFLKDQPELRAEALERYKRFKQLERHIKDKIGFMGEKGLVEMDHPISFALLKKTGNLAESIRVNPIAQDINSWKSKLDKRLNMYQDRIAAGKNTSRNIKGLRALNELNQTLFGKGSPYFKVTETGVSEIGGLPEQIYEGDLLKRFRKNLGLHKTLKTNIQKVSDDVWEATGLNKNKLTTTLNKLGKDWNQDLFETYITEWTKANPKWTKILEGRAGCLSSGGRVGLAAGTGPSECLKNKIRNEPGLIMKAFRSLPKSGRIGAVIAGLGAVGAGTWAMFGGSEAVADEPTMKFNATEGRFVDNEGDPETQEGVLNWIGEHPVYSGLAPIPVGMGAGLGADMMKAPKIANFFKSMKFMLPPAYAAEKLYQYKEGEDLGEMFTNPLDAVWAMALDTKGTGMRPPNPATGFKGGAKWNYYKDLAKGRAGWSGLTAAKQAAAVEAETLGLKNLNPARYKETWGALKRGAASPASRGTRLVFPFGTEKYGFGKAKKLAARGLPRALGIGARMLPLGPLPMALLAGSMAWDKYKFNQKVGDHIDQLRVRGVVSEEDADTMDTIYKQGWLGTTALGAKLLGSEELMFEGETRDLDWQKGVLDQMKEFYQGREKVATKERVGDRQEDFFSWFNRGGRVGLSEGGPPRGVSRRTFLKWLVGSIAAGVAALSGKGAKQAVKTATTTAAKTPQKFMNVEGMPSWFPRAVAKIKTHGKLIDMADKDYVNGDIYQMMIPVKTPKYDTVAGKRTLSGYENTHKKVLLEENPLSGEIEISWNVVDMDGDMIRSIRFQPGKSGYQKFGVDDAEAAAKGVTEYQRVKVDSPEFTYGSPDQSDPLRKEFEFMDISTEGDEVVEGLAKMTKEKNVVTKDGSVIDVSAEGKGVDEAFQKKIYKDIEGEEAIIPDPEGHMTPDGWSGDKGNEIIEGIIPDHLKKAEGGIIARRPGAVAPLSGPAPEGIMSLSFNPKRVNVVGS